MRGIRSSM
uniref:Uncharacterized protein n=1 Tax=Arundo donax TaxID=35708 RepID=A0A0A9FHR4_ARUDO